MRKLIVGAVIAVSVSGCVGKNTGLLQGPPITEVATPYASALTCLAKVAGDEPNKPVVAVGAIADRTGLSDPVAAEDEVFVFQALSGG